MKAVTMIDPVTWWFKITQYNDKINANDRKISGINVDNQVSLANRESLWTNYWNSLVMSLK